MRSRSKRIVKGIAKKRLRKKQLFEAVNDLDSMEKENYPGEHAMQKKQQEADNSEITNEIADELTDE